MKQEKCYPCGIKEKDSDYPLIHFEQQLICVKCLGIISGLHLNCRYWFSDTYVNPKELQLRSKHHTYFALFHIVYEVN